MPKVKEGFKQQRIITLTREVTAAGACDPLIKNLYITKIGYFPSVKYHYVRKENGADYCMIIHCTAGEGWVETGGARHSMYANSYVILPAGVPYSFGASEHNPWTIYWIHFRGNASRCFVHTPVVPRPILPDDDSRIHDRIELFEEIYSNIEMSFSTEYYTYSCMVLYHYLSSFTYLAPFRRVRTMEQKARGFVDQVTAYMREHIETQLTLDGLASHFGYSPSHFSMLFRRHTNQSPIDYFIKIKMQTACKYLELTDLKSNQISSKLGFKDTAYFTRVFTRVTGVSPAAYRKQEL